MRLTPSDNNDVTQLGRPPRAIVAALVAVGIVVLCVAGAASRPGSTEALTRFSAAYLVNYVFFLTISLGALFFVVLQHLVRAGWSVAVRRLAEMLAINAGWWALLFLPMLVPVVLGTSNLYVWSRPEVVAADSLLQAKAPYLNEWFFTVRAFLYFLIWGTTAHFFLTRSTRQDVSRDPALTRRMEKAAPAAMILFGLTVTFASFDWLMSLTPDWFSTIYGLYVFAGAAVAGLAALILLAMTLQGVGLLRRMITVEHYHELGKLLFGFVIFWGYMAFSQYMLIWYANIPEESVWYLARQSGLWAWVTLGLVFGHLLIPFLGMLPRFVKRRKMLLGFWAAWILVFHWIDIYWLVMPTFSPERAGLTMTDLACLVGLGCLFVAGLIRAAGRGELAPVGDPRLGESLAFGNS
ncbi:MAG TPA: quinol:cytochrome C oxidoreductase [Thermoguttaceae bacterium]|nr:quinol:cytochrome C oxidoreductase [Thermoguttaceae bacterium]